MGSQKDFSNTLRITIDEFKVVAAIYIRCVVYMKVKKVSGVTGGGISYMITQI